MEEVAAAGFQLEDETDLLANPADSKNVLIFAKTIKDHSDRFVLKFRKPA